MEPRAEIMEYLANDLMLEASGITIGPKDDLIESGILDSLATMRLVAFIENKYDVRVEATEVVNDNFNSVEAIERLVKSKLD